MIENKSKEQLFNEINELSARIGSLRGIVQNQDAQVSEEELNEWVGITERLLIDFVSLRDNVVLHYSK